MDNGGREGVEVNICMSKGNKNKGLCGSEGMPGPGYSKYL